jgi:hypothetical protein
VLKFITSAIIVSQQYGRRLGIYEYIYTQYTHLYTLQVKRVPVAGAKYTQDARCGHNIEHSVGVSVVVVLVAPRASKRDEEQQTLHLNFLRWPVL